MLKKIVLFLSLWWVAPSYAATSSDNKVSIVAVVNHKVISQQDLNHRVKMMLLGAQGKPSEEELKFLQHKILRQMIAELLELEETAMFDVKAEEEEIENYRREIEKGGRFKEGGLFAFLEKNGIPRDVWIEQTRAGISWSKFVSRLRYGVKVGKQDVDAQLESRKKRGQNRYWLGEIVLPRVSEAQEAQLKEAADGILQALRQGKPFNIIAAETSIAPSAATGGDIDWVDDDQLPQPLQEQIRSMEIGNVSQPILNGSGYHILLLRGKQEFEKKGTRFKLRQLEIPLPQGISSEAQKKQVQTWEAKVKKSEDCGSFQALAEVIPGAVLQVHEDIGGHQLTGGLDQVVEKMAVGEVSGALIPDGKTVMFFMVCDKKEVTAAEKDDENRKAVESELLEKKISSMVANRLKTMHRRASIDIRL